MSSTTNVALAGATGALGTPVLKALLAANFKVTILTRQGSTSTSSLPSHPNQTIKEVDYSSLSSLKSALSNIQVVISTLTTTAAEDTKLLIDAALEAGVTRYIPSEFGSNLSNPNASSLPVFSGKVAVQKHLKQLSSQNSNFTYTLFYNNAFLDWGLDKNFLLSPKDHTATLYDGGDRPFSTTRLSTVAEGLVAVINNLDLTANKEVFVHDGVTTQNKIIAAKKRQDGIEWKTPVKDTDEVLEESYAGLKKGGEGVMGAIFGFLFVAVFKEGYGGDYTGLTWNERLGMKVLNEEEFEKVLHQVVQASG